ncbi:alkaline phosphatase-like [Tubulanus polymorphus]|uniref:alkaline phosphatase-like n=1 Tax=Tubulanus polymorphus TaxID=672921 RepID=UPI003DA6AFCB
MSYRAVVVVVACVPLFYLTGLDCAVPRKTENADFWNKIGQDTLKDRLDHMPNINVAKNVIIFIGDGMGLPTVVATRIYKGQSQGQLGEETQLVYDKFPNVALSKTYNTDHQVADSAGTATAMLCGFKTKYGVLGVDDTVERGKCSTLDPNNKFHSILKWAKDAGKSVGMVTTTKVTHATPGALYAQSVDRNWEDNTKIPAPDVGKCKDIAAQLIDGDGKDLDVIFGGGRCHFYTKSDTDPEYPNKKGKRTDGRNLVTEWKANQKKANLRHTYVHDKNGFDQINPKNVDRVLGLFEYSHMQYEGERLNDTAGEPSIAEMTKKAIEILKKNKNGFFLLVEGGRIDHGHHESWAKLAIIDSWAFEAAIGEVEQLTSVRDTLTVVTADHSHVFDLGGYPTRGSPLFGLNDYENDTSNLPFTTLMYTNGPGYAISKTNGSRQLLTPKQTGALKYRQESGINLKEETHGGEDVSIYARGPMSFLFNGVVEQNYIAHAMGYAACIGPNKNHCHESDKRYNICTTSKGAQTKSYVTLLTITAVVYVNYVIS